ncbi:HPr kinase/phosphorylase [Tuanshanicoccus lijuaniae]|uniref:HPr(Ser) kinase/phosphatase n=1 Tax=Aerococcaceae bacterium zg-1292 TaxID=2774330 RepID=UPI0019381744|nr:HPr kinase/phosphorylase [Aerococcaceae bacterium zg-1292]MBF6978768.1 HPr kinase/phosphorylase [Aerococcaceae bacterium zg-BR22]MBS4456783.1 HPr kinase/phosphorylase [Aerococcaceae bacterium zg-A91]MBS4458575.1 HPr kinase/phosphorylase [Aerococcaceae bacterium zg-BR33]QQA36696.1 HPr kinase/phosphorylase [Aerococcaceae bacterium zg-1292]
MNNTVTINEIVKTLNIEYLFGEAFGEREVSVSEVSRPGLVLNGYIEYYQSARIQLIGRTEMRFLLAQTSEERSIIFDRILQPETPAIIFTHSEPVPDEIFPIAERMQIPILGSRSKTSRVHANITNYLEGRLAERLSRHGVFVEVFGMGVLLIGSSGVGKSETALELVQRGHRLIADDRVELFMIDELTLIGEAPEILQNLLEIRGLGIIDVMNLYGVSAIRRSKRLELIIDLVLDDGTVEYDRLGSGRETEQIFDVLVPKVRIPVKTGRNLASVIESAAMNFRANSLGYNATEAFNKKLDALIRRNQA